MQAGTRARPAKGFACYRWAFCTSICEGKMSREISAHENFSAKLYLIEVILAWWKSFRTRVLVPPNNSRALWLTLVPAVLGSALVFEARTSQFEARALSALSAQLSYRTGPGPSSNISFPSSGPFNEIRGYAELSEFALRLKDAGFHITEQARLSPALEWLSHSKISPPFREPAVAGLLLRGENGAVLYNAGIRQHVFDRYEDIPPLVVKALLFVENRELEDLDAATRNPVVDWSRLGKASLTYAAHKIGLPVRVEGGSTLATQIEKFRYADGGRTNSAADKLRQMMGASLRVYHSGPDTRAQRREIVLDYLNAVPLGAAPRYGEVYGLGNGLFAWFGIDLDQARSVLTGSSSDTEKQRIFKRFLSLICAVRAPSFYLTQNRGALEARVAFYIRQLEAAGKVSEDFAQGVERQPLGFLPQAPMPQLATYVEQKAVNAFRNRLVRTLGVSDLYTVDRLHLDTETTLNVDLQSDVLHLFEKLKNPAFVEANGLRAEHLLSRGDPAQVTYSFTLFERTPRGNLLRVQADTLNQPFDLNDGMKLELGSTAKLRTLAHYLELVAGLYDEFHRLDRTALAKQVQSGRDPITRWTVETISANPTIDLPALLDQALERTYSGNPGEVFFTGGGAHVFGNFEKEENGQIYTLREGFYHSVNLVYIRLLRDLVRFHEARLPYDTDAVLNQVDDPVRAQMLTEIADKESREALFAAFQTYRNLDKQAIVDKLLGSRSKSLSHLAMLFLAWNPNADANRLAQWLESQGAAASSDEPVRLVKSYDPARLNISDYGYLLSRHPLDIWCAGQVVQNPGISWDELLRRSDRVRETASSWLFKTRNRRAQDLRLRIRFEEDAFRRMTPYWQRLRFPFDHLVPSLATAIGSSADRPVALAELIGIILNDGVRLPDIRIERLRFAANTPYETVFAPNPQNGTRVMQPEVARALHHALTGVVENGTARRLANAFVGKDGKVILVGGKTGSGDNRYETQKGSRAVSRTGTFAFYIGDRYFGVITAYVGENKASNYVFTSALPVTAMKLLAPTLVRSLRDGE